MTTRTTRTTRKPARRLPREGRDDIPRFTITVTDERCWLTRHTKQGKPYSTYPVAVTSLGAVFNRFGASTGLLPQNCLFWQNRNGVTRIGVWIPPQRRELSFVAHKGAKKITIPLPGFVFWGEGPRYFICAANEYPDADAPLYYAPLPNVHRNGAICAGSVAFPECSAETIGEAASLFFESLFNQDLSDGKVEGQKKFRTLFAFLSSLTSARTFPHARLVNWQRLDALIHPVTERV